MNNTQHYILYTYEDAGCECAGAGLFEEGADDEGKAVAFIWGMLKAASW